MSKKKVTVVKNDAMIPIVVSGAYYNRICDLMIRVIEKQPDQKQVLINISAENTELTISEAVIQTYMMLIKSVEEQVRETSDEFTEIVEIEVTEDPSES
jgi:hypothetical protein